MPLVRNSHLPTFTRLKHEGRIVLEPERVSVQEIRELHIGFLNMMPDTALEATERQFFRLIGESNAIWKTRGRTAHVLPLRRGLALFTRPPMWTGKSRLWTASTRKTRWACCNSIIFDIFMG